MSEYEEDLQKKRIYKLQKIFNFVSASANCCCCCFPLVSACCFPTKFYKLFITINVPLPEENDEFFKEYLKICRICVKINNKQG